MNKDQVEYNEVVQLHDALYTGILSPYLRDDLPFYPHIGLGLFSNEAYDFNNPTADRARICPNPPWQKC